MKNWPETLSPTMSEAGASAAHRPYVSTLSGGGVVDMSAAARRPAVARPQHSAQQGVTRGRGVSRAPNPAAKYKLMRTFVVASIAASASAYQLPAAGLAVRSDVQRCIAPIAKERDTGPALFSTFPIPSLPKLPLPEGLVVPSLPSVELPQPPSEVKEFFALLGERDEVVKPKQLQFDKDGRMVKNPNK